MRTMKDEVYIGDNAEVADFFNPRTHVACFDVGDSATCAVCGETYTHDNEFDNDHGWPFIDKDEDGNDYPKPLPVCDIMCLAAGLVGLRREHLTDYGLEAFRATASYCGFIASVSVSDSWTAVGLMRNFARDAIAGVMDSDDTLAAFNRRNRVEDVAAAVEDEVGG